MTVTVIVDEFKIIIHVAGWLAENRAGPQFVVVVRLNMTSPFPKGVKWQFKNRCCSVHVKFGDQILEKSS